MPELPEVETVCRGLAESLAGAKLLSVRTSGKRLREPIPRNFGKVFIGQKISRISRRAKFIIWEMESGSWINHLGMSGHWRQLDGTLPHDHLLLQFDNQQTWVFNDARRFGLVAFGERAANKWLGNLGPEPFDEQMYSSEYLFEKTRGRQRDVKTFLMDQKIVVGVGNIYAAEILFRAKISPKRQVRRLSKQECSELAGHTRKVLQEAVDLGGTTFRTYRNSRGEDGAYQQKLFVYDRNGEPCLACKKPIRKITQGGRSSFYCSHCQR